MCLLLIISDRYFFSVIMQPKCSASTNDPAQLLSNSLPALLIPVERFKETALKLNSRHITTSNYTKDVSSVLDHFFDPLKELNLFKSDLDLLKVYLAGGYTYEAFKTKCKQIL